MKEKTKVFTNTGKEIPTSNHSKQRNWRTHKYTKHQKLWYTEREREDCKKIVRIIEIECSPHFFLSKNKTSTKFKQSTILKKRSLKHNRLPFSSKSDRKPSSIKVSFFSPHFCFICLTLLLKSSMSCCMFVLFLPVVPIHFACNLFSFSMCWFSFLFAWYFSNCLLLCCSQHNKKISIIKVFNVIHLRKRRKSIEKRFSLFNAIFSVYFLLYGFAEMLRFPCKYFVLFMSYGMRYDWAHEKLE